MWQFVLMSWYRRSAYARLAPYSMINPLIVMIGVGKYTTNSRLPPLDGVYNDYRNVKRLFHIVRRYAIAYMRENNNLVYLPRNNNTNVQEIDDEFKLKWTAVEIEEFNKEIVAKYLSLNTKYDHDSLIYVFCRSNLLKSYYF